MKKIQIEHNQIVTLETANMNISPHEWFDKWSDKDYSENV